jgi:glycosyltransferase involved in cell wall biosynthesis
MSDKITEPQPVKTPTQQGGGRSLPPAKAPLVSRLARSISGGIHYHERIVGAKGRLVAAAKFVLKPGTRKFRVASRIAKTLGLIDTVAMDIHYWEWVEQTEPYTWSKQKALGYRPKISIVVPVYNPPAKYFLPMVYSVVNQTYDNWELLLVNASTNSEHRQQTENCNSIDERVKVINLSGNKGIAGNTNAGIKRATGDYIGLLDHDDLLAPAALYEVALALQDSRSAGLIYSDEDKVTASGEERFDPHFKPDWSPHLLRELNYLNHFTIIKTDLVNKVGGYRPGFEGAQDYDLFLRIIDQKPEIIHIPKILYHWRTTETSTSLDFSRKKNILNAGIRALEDHLERNNQKGTVTALKKQPGFYKISYKSKTEHALALIVMPGPISEQYQRLVETLAVSQKGTSQTVELFAGELTEKPNESLPKNVTLNFIKKKTGEAFIEAALEQTQATACVLINSGVTPTTNGWLKNLSSTADQIEDAGAITPLLTDTSGETIFDAGYAEHAGRLRPIFRGYLKGTHTYFGNTDWVRNLDALSGRCVAIKTGLLKEYLKDNGTNRPRLDADDLSEYLRARKLQPVLWPFVRFIYRGDMFPNLRSTKYFSPALTFLKEEFNLPKTINIPPLPEENDD